MNDEHSLPGRPFQGPGWRLLTDKITELTAEQADTILSFLDKISAALWEIHEDQLVDLVLREAPPPENDLDSFFDEL